VVGFPLSGVFDSLPPVDQLRRGFNSLFQVIAAGGKLGVFQQQAMLKTDALIA
jgi:hypothetical protein